MTEIDSGTLVATLSTITEFSVGLAGFAGVSAALLHRGRRIYRVDRVRVPANIGMALLPGFVAFTVIALDAMGVDSSKAVHWGSRLLIILLGSAWVVLGVALSRLDDDERARLNRWVSGTIQIITIVVFITQIYNVAVVPEGAFGVLVLGLSLVLVISGAMFTGMVWQMMGYETIDHPPSAAPSADGAD